MNGGARRYGEALKTWSGAWAERERDGGRRDVNLRRCTEGGGQRKPDRGAEREVEMGRRVGRKMGRKEEI